MEHTLLISNISKRYGKKQALTDISLIIPAGSCHVLAGPNGAGKTTLVKSVCGLLSFDRGTIEINDTSIQDQPVKAKTLIGYIPDDPFSYPYLTGRQIIEYIGDLHELSRGVTHKRSRELIKLFGIAPILDERFSDYSRGNKQKIMIIASLLHNPKLLVIDEPIVGLDAQGQVATKQLILQFKQNGGAILLSTHSLEFAGEVADDISFINHGQIIKQGPFTTLKKELGIKDQSLETLYHSVLNDHV